MLQSWDHQKYWPEYAAYKWHVWCELCLLALTCGKSTQRTYICLLALNWGKSTQRTYACWLLLGGNLHNAHMPPGCYLGEIYTTHICLLAVTWRKSTQRTYASWLLLGENLHNAHMPPGCYLEKIYTTHICLLAVTWRISTQRTYASWLLLTYIRTVFLAEEIANSARVDVDHNGLEVWCIWTIVVEHPTQDYNPRFGSVVRGIVGVYGGGGEIFIARAYIDLWVGFHTCSINVKR